MRICFFGDSFVNGTGDDDALGWVGRVVAQARQSGCDLTAYNLGIRRNTSAHVAGRWRGEARLRLPPEDDCRLVFSFGANDCSDDEKGNPRVKASESVSNAGAILEAALDWLPTLMIGPATVGGDTVVNERVFALSAELATLCRRLSAPYLEICRVTSGSSPWTDEALAGDGAHPNRGGYTLVADAVSHWSAWRAWLPPRAAARGMG